MSLNYYYTLYDTHGTRAKEIEKLQAKKDKHLEKIKKIDKKIKAIEDIPNKMREDLAKDF